MSGNPPTIKEDLKIIKYNFFLNHISLRKSENNIKKFVISYFSF